MPLTLTKLATRHSPWRIVYHYPPGRWHPTSGQGTAEVPDCGFRTKRDALPFLARLEAVGDWDQWEQFTMDQEAQVQAILDDTPMRQALHALRQRGVVAPG